MLLEKAPHANVERGRVRGRRGAAGGKHSVEPSAALCFGSGSCTEEDEREVGKKRKGTERSPGVGAALAVGVGELGGGDEDERDEHVLRG